MQKIQLTLTEPEENILALRAASLGYNLTRFVKFLISREVFTMSEAIPTFELSDRAEKTVLLAKEEYLKGKAKPLMAINEFKDL